MFAQLSLAAVALAPLASALTLQIPVDWHSSSEVNISWSNTPTDPPFSLQLVNNIFHDTFSIANNLQPSADFAQFQLGVIPPDTYTLRAINVTNANQIYDETPQFQILPPLSTSSSSASSTAPSSAATSGSVSASVTGATALTAPASSSTSGFGVTVSASNSAAGASGASGSNTATGVSSTDSAVPSSFNGNNGAASLPHLTPWAITALGIVAGAAAAL
ncbi:hypothetical protein BD414DRAFT_491842 [Trametes punicea]|nr:hypothetical protein BD414DRAFT_491842 [Trametes punicea]